MVMMAILQSSIDHSGFSFQRLEKSAGRNTSLESMGSPHAIGQAVADGYETPMRKAAMQRAQWTPLGWSRSACGFSRRRLPWQSHMALTGASQPTCRFQNDSLALPWPTERTASERACGRMSMTAGGAFL